MNRPLSTKERKEIGILRFLSTFQECEKLEKDIKWIR